MTRFLDDQFAKEFLKELLTRLGEVETILEIIEPFLQLPPEEFTILLLQLSREELLSRFGSSQLDIS